MSASTWSQWDKFWTSKAEHASFLAAEFTGDVCIPVHALAPDDELAVDSLSKLIVLGALTQYIDQGGSWSETLKIHEKWKSRSLGSFQEKPAGAEFTLYESARQMIANNDNTAADHLILFWAARGWKWLKR